jgi:hypothetical protein
VPARKNQDAEHREVQRPDHDNLIERYYDPSQKKGKDSSISRQAKNQDPGQQNEGKDNWAKDAGGRAASERQIAHCI